MGASTNPHDGPGARRLAPRGVLGPILGLIVPLLACVSATTAELGDVPLESGDVLQRCRVGYRTFGRLDAARSNVVLMLTSFRGTSRQMAGQIGPGKLVDSSRYFVVVVDALGNGVSSSPSNSASQAGAAFPRISVRDLVETQRRLVTEVLQVRHLHAVVGTSFGAMQAFQWVVSHPGLVDRAVAIAGAPRLADPDRAEWRRVMAGLRDEPRWPRVARALSRGALVSAFEEVFRDPLDAQRQAEAIVTHDVASTFGGSMVSAAHAVRARLLVVVAEQDSVVGPGPAIAFARLAGAEVLQLDGRCGHAAPACETATLWPVVDAFLAGRSWSR